MKKTHYLLFLLITFFIATSCNNDVDVEKSDIPQNYEGYTLIWNDEFNTEQIDSDKWVFELGNGTDYGLPAGWGNNELQIYTDNIENAYIVDDENESVLAITALGNQTDGYTSAKLTTKDVLSMRYGRLECKVKMPKGQGLLPAIWMLGDNRDEIDWPGCGEIDIMEMLGHEPEKMHSTLHFTNAENKHEEIQETLALTNDNFSDSYHVIRFDWNPEKLEFSVDGNKFGSIAIRNDMKEYLRSFYLILNIAVGGNWPGYPDETTTFPQTMYIDYIRVYSQNDITVDDPPALDLDEETVGQNIPHNIGLNAISTDFTDFAGLSVTAYGPGEPEIFASDQAVDGDSSLAFSFPGGAWGGAYIQLDQEVNLSKYTHLKFALNMPETVANAEIKLENTIVSSSAVIFLEAYTGTPVEKGFKEYAISLNDFIDLDFSQITIPFAIWNPQDESGEFIKADILIDNIRFE